MSRHWAERRGRHGEGLAALWLRLRGWRIVGRRVRTKQGEIDLIAKRWRTLAFVEVKTRGTAENLATSIDQNRLRRVAAAADSLVARFGKGATNIRIDVVLVRPWKLPVHLPNVWHG